jgi:MFS transporter, Spinster family, sphingosine-1-phosphate transporter
VIRRPTTILVLLTGLNLLNYLDRFVLSSVLPKVQDDLHLSNFVGGSLATVFLIGYFMTSPVFGVLADRSRAGRKALLAVGITVWSLATVGSGLAHGPWALVAARALVGVGEASYATIAPTIIDEVAPIARKGRWMAIFYAATPVGSALGYLVGGAVESATHSWRQAFFVAGVPGIALAFLCLLLAAPQSDATAPTPERPAVLGSAREFVGNPLYRISVLGYCAYTFAIGGFAFWAPKYLHARYDMETGHASFVFGLVTVVAGLLGTLIGGQLADRATRNAKDEASVARGNLVVCAISAGLGAPLAAAAIAAPTSNLFFILVFPCEVALFLQSGPVNVAVLRSVPVGLRASAMALSIWMIHLLGDLWSPPLIGLAADHWPIEWAMFAGPLFFGLSAILWWRGRLARTSQGAAAG